MANDVGKCIYLNGADIFMGFSYIVHNFASPEIINQNSIIHGNCKVSYLQLIYIQFSLHRASTTGTAEAEQQEKVG